MSQYFLPIGGVWGGLIALFIAGDYTQSELVMASATALGVVVGMLVWYYSPLPLDNIPGSTGSRRRKWGFTNEPANKEEQ